MILSYSKVQSTVIPDTIDITSSRDYVYLRKNVEEKHIVDHGSDEELTIYEYDEATVTREEYQLYLNELNENIAKQQRADIDYIALMLGVDL